MKAGMTEFCRKMLSTMSVCRPRRLRSASRRHWLMSYAPGGLCAGGLCAGGLQLVHGPGPDGLILVELAEGSRVFPLSRQPVLVHPAVVVLPAPIIPSTRISRAPLTGPGYAALGTADIRSPAPPGSFTLA